MAMLEQLVRSKQAGNSQRSAVPDTSRGLPNPLQGMGLAWPWAQQQAPQLQGGATSAGDSVLERLTGSLPGWFKGSEDSAPDGSAAGRQPVDSTAAPSSSDDSPAHLQDTPTVPRAPLAAPQQAPSTTGSVQNREGPVPVPQSASNEAASPSSLTSRGPAPKEGPRAGEPEEAARAAGQSRGGESADAAARREEDLTRSFLEAWGLPLRLREDGLPEASTAAAEERLLRGQ